MPEESVIWDESNGASMPENGMQKSSGCYCTLNLGQNDKVVGSIKLKLNEKVFPHCKTVPSDLIKQDVSEIE